MAKKRTMLSQYVECHKKKMELEQKEAELLPTQLKNLGYIPMIFEHFCELKGVDKERIKTLSSDQRKEFVFIALYFYCPIVIVDDDKKMINGLRQAITDVFKVKAPSGISNKIPDIYCWFIRYRVNQNSTIASYENIAKYLVEQGIIKEYLPFLCE